MAMLEAGVPNIEMHLYGTGRHPGDQMNDGTRMAAGLADRNGIPFGKWQDRFIDWFRDLGFLQKPGVETKAAMNTVTLINSNRVAAAFAKGMPLLETGEFKIQAGRRDG